MFTLLRQASLLLWVATLRLLPPPLLLLPALLTSRPGPATPRAHRSAAAVRLPSTRTGVFGINMARKEEDDALFLPGGCLVYISGK